MAISLQTNMAAISAQRHLSFSQRMLETSLSRLSSGYRINSAADDAAGLGVSENLKAQLRSIRQAVRNANDGLSMVNTAEGGMQEISDILVRMRELVVQSASDGIGNTERTYVNAEVSSLISEIDRISSVTEYNGTNLLDGTLSCDFQVGIRNTVDDRLSLSLSAVNAGVLGVSGVNAAAKSAAQASITLIDTGIERVSTRRAAMGAFGNRMLSTIKNLEVGYENLSAANSRIRDVDVAKEAAQFSRAQVLVQSGVSMLAQANATPMSALKLLG